MLRLFFFCVFSTTVIAGCRQAGSNQRSLQFDPQISVLYKLTVGRHSTQQWTYQHKPWTMEDSSQVAYSFQLLRKSDSLFLLKLQFSHFKMGNQSFQVNTELKNESPEAAHQKPMLLYNYLLHFVTGESIKLWVDKKGRVVQVNGTDELINTVAKKSGESVSLVRLYLQNFTSKEIITDEINQVFCFLPAKAKSVGQAWVENIVLIAKAPVKWSNTCVLRTVKNDTADIGCSSYLSARQGGDGRTYMKGKQAADIRVDYSTGIPYSWNSQSETVTSTDVYDITTRQSLTTTVVAVKPVQ